MCLKDNEMRYINFLVVHGRQRVESIKIEAKKLAWDKTVK